MLEVTYNSIRELPDGIQKLPYLQSLYLQQNQFSSFPESIMGIKNLQRLSLAGNQIQELPVITSYSIHYTKLYDTCQLFLWLIRNKLVPHAFYGFNVLIVV